MRVHLDFETRSLLDLKKVGGYEYARHPSTSVICLSYRVDDGPIKLLRYEDIVLGFDDELAELAADENVQFAAHNAFFEQNIWHFVMELQHGYPPIAIPRWMCTAAKAASFALPRKLEQVSKALSLKTQKDMAGNKAMLKLSKPRRNGKFWEPTEVPEEFEQTYAYNMQDVEGESELDTVLPDLTPEEQELWCLDQRLNLRGIRVDLPLVRRALSYIQMYVSELLTEFKQVTQGYVQTPGQIAKLAEWCEANGVPMSDMQAATVDSLLKNGSLPDNVRRALEIRRQLSKISTAKYQQMLTRSDEYGILRDILLFHAASTGRWAGRGVQLHNLPRPTCSSNHVAKHIMECDYETFKFLYPDFMGALSSLTRGALISRDGYDFVVADYSAIEACVVSWLADQQDVVELFMNKGDVYSAQATSIYGRPINRKVDIAEGMVGKVAILALGYQGGIGAFASMAKNYRLDLHGVYEVIWPTVDPDERAKAIKAEITYARRTPEPIPQECAWACDVVKQRWRAANDKIVSLWYAVEAAAIEAVQTGKLVKCGKVHFGLRGRGPHQFLMCRLPSGRKLAFHKPELRLKKTPWGEMKPVLSYMTVVDGQYIRRDSYGGLLVENITQAIARDIMAGGFKRAEDRGYIPVLSIHDEGVAEVREGEGDIEEYCRLLEQPPSWAAGLPIRAEGWRGKRYRK